MALPTPCQTPDAGWLIAMDRGGIVINVAMDLDLSDEQAVLLEANLHNAVELAIASVIHRNGS